MILTTTSEIQNYTIEKTIGLVSGNMVQSKHVGRDIMAGLKTLVGGEISGYTEMLIEAVNKLKSVWLRMLLIREQMLFLM